MARSPAQEETGAVRFADGLLEAGWLLALLVVPSFFDVYSRHPFEPDKVMVVRILALLTAAAGLARALPAWRRWRWPRGAPLLLPVLVYLGAAALSTALSVAPRRSLWGSYTRGEGLVTLVAYLVVFTALCARLRARDQLDRAIDAIVAGSVPVALYGLVQAAGLDPLVWKLTYQEWRVSTTLGNPVFAGSYLILTLPLTVAALIEWRSRPAPAAGWRRTRLVLYALAAVLQVSVLALTGSRGPWLGGAAALVAFVLLGAAVSRRRRLAAAALAASVAAVALVALLNIPGGPLERARQTRLLGRLAHLLDGQGERNPGDRARVRVWEGALELARPRPPLPLPDGEDPRAALRPLIGYGPETLQVAFAAVYDAELARQERRNPDLSDYGVSTFYTRIPDRAHNELLDSLVTGGLLGALAHLLLAVAIQVFGLRAVGLLATQADRLRLAAFGLAGAVVGALAAGLALSWAFLGVALPLGLVAGWMAYVLACAFRRSETRLRRPSTLALGLLAALVGHFVDIQFGPSVVTGRLYFWSLTGLLVAHFALRRDEEGTADAQGEPAPSQAGRWRGLAGGAAAGALGAALAVTLLFDFIDVGARQPNVLSAAGHLLRSAPARAVTALGAASVLLLVLLETGRRRGPRAPAALGALVIVAVLGVAFAAMHVSALGRTAEARKVGDLAWALGGVFARYVLWLLALAALLGASLLRRGPRAARAVESWAALRTAAVLLAALAAGLPPALASVGADIMLRFAGALQDQAFVADGLALFDRAAETAPWEAAGFRSQGEAYLTASRRTGSPVRRQEYLSRAETAFARARVLDPLGPDNHANLARLARWRAELARVPAVALREADEASRHYAAAARLFPANTLLLNEWAELDFVRRRDFAAAEEKLHRSLRLDPSFDYTYAALGDMYMARARAAAGDPREDYRRAADAYARAWERRNSLKASVSLGLAYERLGETDRAVDAYNRALGMNPPHGTAWAIHEQLAGLYLALGNRQEAERHARDALGKSPTEKERNTLLERLRSAGLAAGG